LAVLVALPGFRIIGEREPAALRLPLARLQRHVGCPFRRAGSEKAAVNCLILPAPHPAR
jgi:hypothetical protein